MKLKTTLRVFNETDVPEGSGIVPGQIRKRLAGTPEHPSERIMSLVATFKVGTLEHLHWHLTEAFHYVISGRAVVRDIEGKEYEVGPGSIIYAPPGVAGSHEWEVKEDLKLIAFRATTDPQRNLQIWVDQSTLESRIDFDHLVGDVVAGGAVDFKKSLY